MKAFHCESCGNLLFFENTTCVTCGHTAAFLPDTREVESLEAGDGGTWLSVSHGQTPLCQRWRTPRARSRSSNCSTAGTR